MFSLSQRSHVQALDVEEAIDQDHRPNQVILSHAVRSSITKVHHELSNPLSIISGNVQLLLELARMIDLDDDLMGPMQDIEEASQQMEASLHKLINLKEAISK